MSAAADDEMVRRITRGVAAANGEARDEYVHRLGPGVGILMPRTWPGMDDADRAMSGTLPADPADDARPMDHDSAVDDWIDAEAEREAIKEEARSKSSPVAGLVIVATRAADPIPTIGVSEIFAALAPRVWIVDRLRIAGGGRPTLIDGPPGGGKTIVAQTMALAVASGRRWCGLYPVRQSRVLHLDGEVGHYLTCERYQRLARAMSIDPADLGESLRVAVYPALTLDQRDAEAVLVAACTGYGLVIVDSLTALGGDAEEHTPEMGRLMLMLARVSGATGAAIVVLHHTRRDGEIRGSTSIPAGAECRWHMADVDRGRSTLQHERSPMGDPQPDLTLQIADVEIDGDPRGGLTVRVLDPERTIADQPGDAHARLLVEVIDYLRREGPVPGGTHVLAARLGRRAAAVATAVRELVATGRVVDSGRTTDRLIRLVGGTP